MLTEAGSSLSPGRMTNVAGTLTLVDPPPEAPTLEVGAAPPVARVAPVVPGCPLVVPVAGAAVEVAELEAGAAAVVGEETALEEEALLEEETALDEAACLEPPHAPTSANAGSRARSCVLRLTLSA